MQASSIDLDDSVQEDVTSLTLVNRDNAAPKANGAIGHQSIARDAKHSIVWMIPQKRTLSLHRQMRECQTPR